MIIHEVRSQETFTQIGKIHIEGFRSSVRYNFGVFIVAINLSIALQCWSEEGALYSTIKRKYKIPQSKSKYIGNN